MARVHFSDTNIFYSAPSTPSPTLSSSSLPSSSGPQTPPPNAEHDSPYPFLPLSLDLVDDEADNVPTVVHIHPLLLCNQPPPIIFDLIEPPDTILTHKHVPVSFRVLSEPATNPPLPAITMMCPYLPWSIKVEATSTDPGAFVTVADVIDSLHRILRTPVTPLEYRCLPSLDDERCVNEAYQSRYKRFTDRTAYDTEKAKGIKRIDFLMGRTRFMGLSSTLKGPDVWALHVGK